MRKFKVFLALLPLLVFVGCSAPSPEVVAEEFVKALYTADFEKAKTYCTEDSKQAVDFAAAFAAEIKEEMQKSIITIEQESLEIAEDGNSAVVKLIIHGAVDLDKTESADSKSEKINLIKSNDKWLVSYKLK